MEKEVSLAALALEGVERLREKNNEPRGRVCALPLLLRGAYFTGEAKWRAYAEEDLRALWRGGVHDHIGGGFFCASFDREWLRPVFEKRLDDNAVLALIYTEAWEKGRMGFYREAAEETLDFCLRELQTPSGLCGAALTLLPEAAENPYLFTPAQIGEILGSEGRHFAECYDITDEPNCGEGSVPNLILNERWSLLPEGYDELRERVRLARGKRGGVAADPRTDGAGNALLIAALARAGRVFSARRRLTTAEELLNAQSGRNRRPVLETAALLFARTELYAADLEPRHLAAAAALAAQLEEELRAGEGLPAAEDRALSLAALGLDALRRLGGEERWLYGIAAILRELSLRPEAHGPESLSALCADFTAVRAARTLLCVSPEEEIPAALEKLRARYAPDLAVLLKTPGRARALAAAAPWTEEIPIGEETLFYPREGGKIGAPHRL